MTGAELARLLARVRFNIKDEAELQAALVALFASFRDGGEPIAFAREVVLGPKSRVDFFFDPGLAVEVKILGATNAVLRQLGRYAEVERVRELALVTTRQRLAAAMPASILGKTITAICLERNVFG